MSKRWEYETGLQALDAQLVDAAARQSFEELASVLRQHLQREQLYGQLPPEALAERRQSVLALNQLARAHLSTSFNALCLVDTEEPWPARLKSMNYEQGLAQLQAALSPDDSAAIADYWDMEHRLWVNLTRDLVVGPSPSLHRERAELIMGLNQLAIAHTGRSFNELCSATP